MFFLECSGGSKISQMGGGVPTPEVGVKTYNLARILSRGELAPLGSANGVYSALYLQVPVNLQQ